MQEKGRFDAEAFYDALDGVRQSRKMSWRQVAKEANVSASTLTRMAQGRRPDVDGLIALMAWSGLDAADYVVPQLQRANREPLAMVSTLLRSDKNLDPETAEKLTNIIKVAYQQLRK